MKIIATNYHGDCSWIPKLTDDYFIYDRTGCGLPNSKMVPNIGNADFDKITYIVDNYDNLPEYFMLIKSNLFKYITPEEFEKVKDNKTFTPLLTQNHMTDGKINFYKDNIYWETNNSWYVPQFPSRYRTYNEWAAELGLPQPEYLPFAPGGNYIVTREAIHKWPKSFYARLLEMLGYTQLPAEAQFLERTYYTLWR